LKKILFVCENDPRNQSTKHRVLDVIAHLKIADYRLHCGGPVRIGGSRVMMISAGDYFRIMKDLREADLLFVQRASCAGMYLLCLAARRLGAEIVFDVDDAIFTKRVLGLKNPLYSYFDAIARTADRVFAGSRYIEEYARRLNADTLLVPTAVNMEIFGARSPAPRRAAGADVFTIGWLGAGEIHLPSLLLLREPLRELATRHRIRFKLVSSLGSRSIREAFGGVSGLEVDYGRDEWIPLEEIPREMADVDASVMPLVDTPYARGKCALKALESMAMRIPVVASGVGENNHVIRHGENGYLANTAGEWVRCLEELIRDHAKRRAIAESGFATVACGYTIPAVSRRIAEALGIGED
jgi:glycosyltransferase involved in cell wall biosynthesis